MIFPGIDLGTTFSMVAHVNAHGQPALFPDVHNASLFRTPSTVYVGREGCLVGAAAEELLDDTPDLPVARFVKAHLSTPDWRYADHLERHWPAEGLSALILRKLLRDVDTFTGEDRGPAVLTVPAQFTDEQRRATLRAADLAGMSDTKLVEEPVAAATFYGQDEGPADRTLLVYDFGGGTFDVTILQTARDGLFVLATDGVSKLGGRHLDDQLVALMAAAYTRQFQHSPLSDPGSVQRLRRLAEDSKIKLSRPGLNQVKHAILLMGQPFEFVLTRGMFDTIVNEAVAQTLAATQRCLAAAALDWQDIDKILLTGGSSLLPQVRDGLMRASGKPAAELICKTPHQAVAYGAALLAARYARTHTEGHAAAAPTVRQVSGADLCLRVWDRKTQRPGLEVLIGRNTPLPTTYSRTFYTNRDDQTRIVLELVQRRGEPAEEFSLGHFAFGPISDPRRNYPLEITTSLTEDGLVQVLARDPATGRQFEHTVAQEGSAPQSQDAGEIRRWIQSLSINL